MASAKSISQAPREILDTLAWVGAVISVAEFVAMALVPMLGLGGTWLAWLADAGVLVLVATPLIIALLWRRLRGQNRMMVAAAVAVILLSVEIAVMALLSWLILGSSPVIVAMLDASLVVVISLPLICLVLYKSAALATSPEASWQDYVRPRVQDPDR